MKHGTEEIKKIKIAENGNKDVVQLISSNDLPEYLIGRWTNIPNYST